MLHFSCQTLAFRPFHHREASEGGLDVTVPIATPDRVLTSQTRPRPLVYSGLSLYGSVSSPRISGISCLSILNLKVQGEEKSVANKHGVQLDLQATRTLVGLFTNETNIRSLAAPQAIEICQGHGQKLQFDGDVILSPPRSTPFQYTRLAA